MKRIISYKLFESNVESEEYIFYCFLDISENTDFKLYFQPVKVIEESGVPVSIHTIRIYSPNDIKMLKSFNFSSFDNLSMANYFSVVSEMSKVSLETLKKRQEKTLELLEYIDSALIRLKEIFPTSEYEIYATALDMIDVKIKIKD